MSDKQEDWEIIMLDEFESWLNDPNEVEPNERKSILRDIFVLAKPEMGPFAKRPLVDTLKGSALSNLKELRTDTDHANWRCLFLFAPNRKAIILIGGNKKGQHQDRFYKKLILEAERRYMEYYHSDDYEP